MNKTKIVLYYATLLEKYVVALAAIL